MSLEEPLSLISSALAPVVALSASAILVSNAQTNYSSLVDRLRALNEERRQHEGDASVSEAQALRMCSIRLQIAALVRRASLLRYAMLLLFLGMIFILGTSFMIVSTATFSWPWFALASKWCFFGGLLFVFLAMLALAAEVMLTFRVVRYELGQLDEVQT